MLRYAALAGLPALYGPAEQVAAGAFAADEVPVWELAEQVAARGPQGFAVWVGNRQLTSTRGGILKADAAGQYAAALTEHGVDRISDVTELLRNPDQLGTVEADLKGVRGDGAYGVRRSYLWMLAGDDHHVKPDRMILDWLRGVVPGPVTPYLATTLLIAAAAELGVTPWQLDHAAWEHQRVVRGARRIRRGRHERATKDG